MKLERIPPSLAEGRHHWAKHTPVGYCVEMRPNGLSCDRQVYASTGYADLDGRPFKDYYCAQCALKHLQQGEA